MNCFVMFYFSFESIRWFVLGVGGGDSLEKFIIRWFIFNYHDFV